MHCSSFSSFIIAISFCFTSDIVHLLFVCTFPVSHLKRVKAFIVLEPGYEATEETRQELLKYCKKNIAKYAMPYDLEFRDSLPTTMVGKVAYRLLEEEELRKYEQEHGKADEVKKYEQEHKMTIDTDAET